MNAERGGTALVCGCMVLVLLAAPVIVAVVIVGAARLAWSL